MAIETTCSGCGKLLSVGDEHAGRRARCPACGQVYTIPAGENAGPANSASQDPASIGGPPSIPGVAEDSINAGEALSDQVSPAAGPPSAPANTPSLPTVNMNQFWMRSTEGVEYGPVDRETLDRWFREGRVGPGYMIRQSETGMWQSAEVAKPFNTAMTGAMSGSVGTANNPYSAVAGTSANDVYRQMYPKPDQSGMVLAFGILSWFICPIFGIVAWIMGRNGLKDIAAGLTDPANKGLMQAGYYLGIVNVILYSLCFGGYIVFVALAIGFGGIR